MKTTIHPKWYPEGVVSCACGNRFVVGMTKPEIKVDICSKCHPFFTGEMRYVDTLGRVEKFQQKQKSAKETMQILADKKKKRKEREDASRSPKTLKEMLMGMK